ncbi:MAG: GT-D fold domain-containing glycosyltransferase [Butyricimonas faecihominis]
MQGIVLSVDLGMESSIFYVRKGMDFALLINPWPKITRSANGTLPCHIVCLPYALVSRENLNLRTKVSGILFYKAYDVFIRYLKSGYVYYDASFTRFYLRARINVYVRYLEKIRQIWFDQDILLIELNIVVWE